MAGTFGGWLPHPEAQAVDQASRTWLAFWWCKAVGRTHAQEVAPAASMQRPTLRASRACCPLPPRPSAPALHCPPPGRPAPLHQPTIILVLRALFARMTSSSSLLRILREGA